MQRRHVNYRGRVQGVGFRYTARQVAQDYDVTGYVKNLADGSVELVVEGRADEVNRFLGDLESRLDRYILDKSIDTLAASGEFSGFEIRF